MIRAYRCWPRCSGGAKAEFSFRLTFAADGKAGVCVERRDVCVCMCEIFGKTCGGVMRAECVGQRRGATRPEGEICCSPRAQKRRAPRFERTKQ